MFIVWGTKSRQEDGGVVGDWCDQCGGVRFIGLTHYFRVSHVYYIPMGKGTYAGTLWRCTQCGKQEMCDMRTYARTLTQQEAWGRNMDEILQLTNPALHGRLSKQFAFQNEMAHRVQGIPSGPSYDVGNAPVQRAEVDPRMLEALNILGRFDVRREEVAAYLDRLQKWDYLTTSEREVLLHEIDAFTREDASFKAIVEFLKYLPTPSPDWMFGMGCVGYIVALIVGFSSVSFLQSWLWGPLFVIAALVLVVFCYSKIQTRYVRNWVNKVLIPRANQAHIDLSFFVSVLSELKSSSGLESRVNDMANNIATIADELAQRGQISLAPQTPMEQVRVEQTPIEQAPLAETEGSGG
jgi:hypothetical protein